MMEDTRGRLTPVDIVFYGVALFLLAKMAGPMYTVLNNNAGELSSGSAYIFQLLFPTLLLTIMAVVYLTAVSGGSYR